MSEHQPELEPQPVRAVDLDTEQSARLTQACGGEFGTVFAVASRATHPHDPQRWRLWIVPSTANQVNKAIAKLSQKPC